jgi:hypothetical protein
MTAKNIGIGAFIAALIATGYVESTTRPVDEAVIAEKKAQTVQIIDKLYLRDPLACPLHDDYGRALKASMYASNAGKVQRGCWYGR